MILQEKNYLYSVNRGSGDVTVVNTANNSLIKKIKTGVNPNDIILFFSYKNIKISINLL
jgi:YVTN family beta-propeller protein